jgi:hypothetical protein
VKIIPVEFCTVIFILSKASGVAIIHQVVFYIFALIFGLKCHFENIIENIINIGIEILLNRVISV